MTDFTTQARALVAANDRAVSGAGERMPAVTLTEFLLEQIAVDEAVAREATPGPWRVAAEGSEGSRIAPDCEDKRTRSRFIGILNGRVQPEDGYNAAHIARHDPAHVLAVCEAHRRIVERAQQLANIPNMSAETCGRAFEYDDHVLRALAAIYADRDGFRESWR